MNENKFNGMGKIYSKYRPSYPFNFIDYLFTDVGISKNSIIADIGSGTGILTGQLLEKGSKVYGVEPNAFNFIDYLFTDVGISKNSIIADIGSGTGILTGQLLEKGSKVYGVEPNADMRVIAETNLKDLPRFTSVNGCAENTTIDDNSVDYITVAQAFHWFDRERFKKECQRILKAEGKVILVWNVRDNKNELVMENYKVNRKYCPSFNGFSDGMYGKNNEDDFSDFFNGKYETKVFLNNLIFDMDGFIGRNLSSSYFSDGMYGKNNEDDFSDFFNGKYETKVFLNNLIFDMDGFIGRNLSSSYSLKSNDAQYDNYVNELKKVYEKYSSNGQLIMPNLTCSYIGNV